MGGLKGTYQNDTRKKLIMKNSNIWFVHHISSKDIPNDPQASVRNRNIIKAVPWAPKTVHEEKASKDFSVHEYRSNIIKMPYDMVMVFVKIHKNMFLDTYLIFILKLQFNFYF